MDRRRATQLVLVVTVALFLLACSESDASTGSALSASGPITTGEVGFRRVAAGKVYGFALPVLRNETDDPVTLKSATISKVGAGLRVIKYAALSLMETDGQIVESYIGDRTITDYAKYRNVPIADAVIPPHSTSDLYPVVYLRVLRVPVGKSTGCTVTYARNDAIETQHFACAFGFES